MLLQQQLRSRPEGRGSCARRSGIARSRTRAYFLALLSSCARRACVPDVEFCIAETHAERARRKESERRRKADLKRRRVRRACVWKRSLSLLVCVPLVAALLGNYDSAAVLSHDGPLTFQTTKHESHERRSTKDHEPLRRNSPQFRGDHSFRNSPMSRCHLLPSSARTLFLGGSSGARGTARTGLVADARCDARTASRRSCFRCCCPLLAQATRETARAKHDDRRHAWASRRARMGEEDERVAGSEQARAGALVTSRGPAWKTASCMTEKRQRRPVAASAVRREAGKRTTPRPPPRCTFSLTPRRAPGAFASQASSFMSPRSLLQERAQRRASGGEKPIRSGDECGVRASESVRFPWLLAVLSSPASSSAYHLVSCSG